MVTPSTHLIDVGRKVAAIEGALADLIASAGDGHALLTWCAHVRADLLRLAAPPRS